MRLGTHLKAARTTRRMTRTGTSLLTEVPVFRLATLESGQQLPTRDELTAFCWTYTLDTSTVFLWLCQEIVERVVEKDGERGHDLDEDLIELADRMTTFLAQRGRL